jgi:hypothetical protein
MLHFAEFMHEPRISNLNSMTPEQRRRMDDLIDRYKKCFIVHGPFHAKHNEWRVQKFLDETKPESWEFIRITVELTYVFWNPAKKID